MTKGGREDGGGGSIAGGFGRGRKREGERIKFC
jgi:hypothetical protein